MFELYSPIFDILRILVSSLASGKFRLQLYCFSQACKDLRTGRTPGSSVVWSNFLGPGVGCPVVFIAITIASWALRPVSRRLPALPLCPSDRCDVRWIAPTLIVIALFVRSWVFLPKGGPPGSEKTTDEEGFSQPEGE